MNNSSPHRILLVDDDLLLHALLKESLSSPENQFHTLTHGEGLVDYLLQYQQPDLVALDIILPGKDGLYWLGWLKEHYPLLPVLLLSARKSAQDRLMGLQSGADDYLIKPFHPAELWIRIENILRHRQPLENESFRIGAFLFDSVEEKLTQGSLQIKLSTMEASLLLMFCRNTGKTLTRDAIANVLTGADHHPMNRSIDMLVNRLRKKLETNPAEPVHLHTVWRKGYRMVLKPSADVGN